MKNFIEKLKTFVEILRYLIAVFLLSGCALFIANVIYYAIKGV